MWIYQPPESIDTVIIARLALGVTVTATNRRLAICLWAHQSIDCLGYCHLDSKSEGYTYYHQFGEIDPIRLK